jgi:hypothetical protein
VNIFSSDPELDLELIATQVGSGVGSKTQRKGSGSKKNCCGSTTLMYIDDWMIPHYTSDNACIFAEITKNSMIFFSLNEHPNEKVCDIIPLN